MPPRPRPRSTLTISTDLLNDPTTIQSDDPSTPHTIINKITQSDNPTDSDSRSSTIETRIPIDNVVTRHENPGSTNVLERLVNQINRLSIRLDDMQRSQERIGSQQRQMRNRNQISDQEAHTLKEDISNMREIKTHIPNVMRSESKADSGPNPTKSTTGSRMESFSTSEFHSYTPNQQPLQPCYSETHAPPDIRIPRVTQSDVPDHSLFSPTVDIYKSSTMPRYEAIPNVEYRVKAEIVDEKGPLHTGPIPNPDGTPTMKDYTNRSYSYNQLYPTLPLMSTPNPVTPIAPVNTTQAPSVGKPLFSAPLYSSISAPPPIHPTTMNPIAWNSLNPHHAYPTAKPPKFNPPSFSGRPDEDVITWSRDYERIGRLIGWNDDQLSAYIPGYLRDKPASIYHSLSTIEKINWNKIKEVLCETFARKDAYSMRYELESRKQRSNESVIDYYSSLAMLYDRCDPDKLISERDKVIKFMSGLLPHIRSMLDAMFTIAGSARPATLSDASRLASHAERAQVPPSKPYQRYHLNTIDSINDESSDGGSESEMNDDDRQEAIEIHQIDWETKSREELMEEIERLSRIVRPNMSNGSSRSEEDRTQYRGSNRGR